MSARTPLPWVIVRSCVGTVHSIEGSDGCAVCYGDIRQADARLIAAAPDLLEALQRIVNTCTVRIDDPRIAHFDAARAAIAKATWSQP